MTSLIDVIFLLLLFFMLSSTFSKFAEVEIGKQAGASAATGEAPQLAFLQLGEAALRLDGQDVPLETLEALLTARLETAETPLRLLVQVGAEVQAQRLTHLLVALRPVTGLDYALITPS